ncbi:MAG: Fic family protein [archaeon]|nr:Fic family protein [Nanoarchaeota archaeon]
MAYVYKKIVGGRNYYYLRISQRVNGKLIVKDVAYLGNSISEIEHKLDQLSQYKNEIRKSYRNIKKFVQSNYYLEKVKAEKLKKNPYFENKIRKELEAIKLHYNQYFMKLNENTKKETFHHFLIDFSFNTTSLEGNTINLADVKLLLEEGILPAKHTLREVYDLQNTEKVFFWLIEKKPLINEKLIVRTHDLLLEGIDLRKGYRQQEIRVFKSSFETSPVRYIKTDIKILLRWYQKNKSKLHPLVLAAIFHHKLEKIHPFADGNGRTGRMLMNYLLIRNKYPPLIVQKKRRIDYLQVLSKADSGDLQGDDPKLYNQLITFLTEEMITSYWDNFNI